MFVLTTVTRDCKNGDLYVSVDDNAYLTKEAASTALRARYEDFLKSMKLEDNGASDENGNAMPGGYCISDEASIYDYADYANCQLLPIVVITTTCSVPNTVKIQAGSLYPEKAKSSWERRNKKSPLIFGWAVFLFGKMYKPAEMVLVRKPLLKK